MLQYFSETFPIFNRAKRTLLLIEVLPECCRTFLIRADEGVRQARILRAETIACPAQLSDDALLIFLSKHATPLMRFHTPEIVLSLGAEYGATKIASAVMSRAEPAQAISETDFENIISQALWKVFVRERAALAQRLHVSDMDVTLADAKILKITLDGHKVMNPVGFTAQQVELQIKLTVVHRKLLDGFRKIFPEEQLVSIEEAGMTWLGALSTLRPQQEFLVAALFNRSTALFERSMLTAGRRDEIAWGTDALFNSIEAAFAVDRQSAEQIFERYLHKQASALVLRKLEQIFLEVAAVIFRALQAHRSRDTRFAYCLAFTPLPPAVFSNVALRRIVPGLKVEFIDDQFISQNFDFQLQLMPGWGPDAVRSVLLNLVALTAFYRDPSLSKIVRRRVRWLETPRS